MVVYLAHREKKNRNIDIEDVYMDMEMDYCRTEELQ
jgi:hypothetical protein